MSYLGRSAKLSLKAQEKVSFLATAGQTVKTGLSYTVGFIEVYVNGVLLTDTTDFTATNGNSITFTVALLLNDEVTVISLKTFTVADHYNKTEADTLLAAKAPVASPSFTGNVGVGNATFGVVNTTDLKITAADDILFNVSGASTDILGLYGNDGTNVNSQVKFAAPVYPSLNNTYDLGNSTERWKDAYLSGGVYLGGTGAANKLDDYEEGTFTATLNGSASNPSTAVTTTGKYRKIGALVYFSISFENSNTTGANGSISVSGLPFTSSASGRYFISSSFYDAASWPSAHTPTSYVEANNTNLVCFAIASGTVWTALSHTAGAARYSWFSGTYPTDS